MVALIALFVDSVSQQPPLLAVSRCHAAYCLRPLHSAAAACVRMAAASATLCPAVRAACSDARKRGCAAARSFSGKCPWTAGSINHVQVRSRLTINRGDQSHQ